MAVEKAWLRPGELNLRQEQLLIGRNFCTSPVGDAEAVENDPRRVRAVECVEMNAGDVVIEEIVTLFEGEMHSDAADHFFIVFTSLKSSQQFCREACAPGQLSDPFESAAGSDWHDARNDRNMDAR